MNNSKKINHSIYKIKSGKETKNYHHVGWGAFLQKYLRDHRPAIAGKIIFMTYIIIEVQSTTVGSQPIREKKKTQQ